MFINLRTGAPCESRMKHEGVQEVARIAFLAVSISFCRFYLPMNVEWDSRKRHFCVAVWGKEEPYHLNLHLEVLGTF